MGPDVGFGEMSSMFTVVPILIGVAAVLVFGSAIVRLVRGATGRGGGGTGSGSGVLRAPDPSWQRTARDDSLVDRYRGGPFAADGFERGAVDVLRGTVQGHPVTAFTYEWHTHEYESSGIGTDSSRRRVVVRRAAPIVAVETGGVVPRLELKPEGVLGGLVNRVTGGEIEVGDPEVDKAWSIRGVDGERTRRFLGPDVRGLLMSSSLRGERIVLDGAYAFVCTSTDVAAVSRDLVALVRSGLSAADGVPPSAPAAGSSGRAVTDAPDWGTPGNG